MLIAEVWPSAGQRGPFPWLRSAATLISLGLFLGFLKLSRALDRDRGTLYYVRLLDESQADFHGESTRRARDEYLDYRSLTRWANTAASGTIDVRTQVRELTTEFELLCALDNSKTKFELGPNLLFPAALALGYGLCPPSSLMLREFNKATGPPEFHLPCARALDSVLSVTPPAATLSPANDFPITFTPASVGSVCLDFRLTTAERHDADTLAFPDLGVVVDLHRTIGVFVGRTPQPVTVGEQDGPGQVDAASAAARVAWEIDRALREFPNATIVLTGQVTKVVSVAAGMCLAHVLDANAVSATHPRIKPWTRLVTLGHVNPELRPMWVWPGQGDPDLLLDPLRTRPDVARLVNLTPHHVAVGTGLAAVSFPPDGLSARLEIAEYASVVVATAATPVSAVDCSYTGVVVDLPVAVDGTGFIVSQVTAARASRADLYFPLGEIRDSAGRIVGCRTLGHFVAR
ncbi:MAG: hypothetical protein DLM58_07490 [Pseudonocardiales bacterium]|nr:MAG: hypothetical protein DLM58_07490 [Pseudonocardiales bacterium]